MDAYFHSRSRESQIGAAVSQQSRPLGSREQLEARFANSPRSIREQCRGPLIEGNAGECRTDESDPKASAPDCLCNILAG